MIQPPCVSTCTFVVRLRREWREGRLVWRGWVQHLPSGERAAVQDWEDVEVFVEGFGVEVEGGDWRWEIGRG